ncbi:MAG: hypothetical protein Q7T71_18855, partial [Herbiconiux sp.]|nr:hypothetical protein [Herbiconiux sp.]
GETAVIGDDVMLYHGVTLGGKSARRTKRHPTLGDRVTVGAGATILGPVTIGSDSNVGAGAVVVRDAAPGAVLVGIPARDLSHLPAHIAPEATSTAPAHAAEETPAGESFPASDSSGRAANPADARATRESLTDPAFYLDPAIYI